MTIVKTQNPSQNYLYNIVREFAQTHNLTGYGNGFDKRGKSYFAYLLKVREDFKEW